SVFPSCFILIIPRPPTSTLFPYTTLFRSLDRHRAGEPLLGGRGLRRLHDRVPGAGSADRALAAQHARPAVRGIQRGGRQRGGRRSEEHTSELQSRENLVCRLLLEKKKKTT